MKNQLIPVLLFLSLATNAQTGDTAGLAAVKHPGYLVSYTDHINASLNYGTYNMQFRLSDASGLKFIFSPNEIYQTKLGLAYSFIDFNYTFSSKVLTINNNTNIKGDTKRNDLAFIFRLNRFYLKVERDDEKGFYLWNTKDFYPDWKPGMPYIQFPDLHVTQTGGSITFNGNRHFSVSSLAGGTEQQLRSAVTFLPTIFSYFFKIRDEDTSVTKGKDEYTRSSDISIGLPVAINSVFAKSWYFSAGAGPAVGINFISSTLVNDDLQRVTQKQSFASLGYSARVAAGWSNRKFFAGIDGSLRGYAHTDNDKVLFRKQFYDASVYIGMRFQPPRFVKNGVDWVKRILPF